MIATSYQHNIGKNCESACQRNVLSFLGLDLDEEVIFGLDGGFGFMHFPSQGNEPDVIVGKQDIFPGQAARLLGSKVESLKGAGTKALTLKLHQQPAIVRVDIGQLPYWGLNGKHAFGGYFVNVIGYDKESGQFTISDPAFSNLKIVNEMELNDARSSRLSPPINPDNQFYIFSRPRREPQLDKIGPVAVRNTARSFLKPNISDFGLPGIRKLAKEVRKWPGRKQGDVNYFDMQGNPAQTGALHRQLLYFGHQIEVFGTGGGLCRVMLSRFIQAVGDATGDVVYSDNAELISASAAIWSKMGKTLLTIMGDTPTSSLHGYIDMLEDGLAEVLRIEKQAFESLKSVSPQIELAET